jgi:uncharacterized protein YpmS
MPTVAASPKKSNFSWFKFARWTFLAVLVIVVLVMLKKPVPPANFSHITPEQATASAASFDDKLNDLEKARASGTPAEVRLTTDELNSAFQRSQGELPQAAASTQPNSTPPAAAPAPSQPPTDAPAQVKSMQFAMVGDQVVGQFVVERYGMDSYVTLSGQLSSKDGYVGLKPTLFKVGDLTVPIDWVDSTLQSKLAEPENREKMKLPAFISDIRVEDGELVIVEK